MNNAVSSIMLLALAPVILAWDVRPSAPAALRQSNLNACARALAKTIASATRTSITNTCVWWGAAPQSIAVENCEVRVV